MLASQQPTSPLGRMSPIGVSRQPKRPTTGIDTSSGNTTEKQPLWIPMLQSASKGKDLIEKQLILLGGNPDVQQEFLGHLNPETSSRQTLRSNDRRKQRQKVPISNKFALGYTYHDVLDADQEDVLARLNIYMLASSNGKFSALLRPLLTGKTVKETLVTILLDWRDPFSWARQLRQWMRLLRKAIGELDEDTKVAMEENMTAWKEKRVGPDAQSSAQQEVVAPPGPGEWDEGLGIPISVVCVQSEKIERLERELGWGDDQFDFLQQWLRTVLLKHGGSLIYTATFEPNNVRTLIHTSLSIQSLLKRETAKHNVIDRDKILIPPNWDSWGKIRILKEGFDPETVSTSWSVEIQDGPEDTLDLTTSTFKSQETETDILASSKHQTTNSSSSAVTLFEQTLPNQAEDQSQSYNNQLNTTQEETIIATPLQEFLQSQSSILEKLKAEDIAAESARKAAIKPGITSIDSSTNNNGPASGTMSPVKGGTSVFFTDTMSSHRVNVNGIDLDAEEATKRLRERESERNALRRAGSENVVSGGASGASSPAKPNLGRGITSEGPSTPGTGGADGKPSNEALHGFFANLIKKGEQGRNRGVGSSVTSGNASPRRESPAPVSRREE